MYTPFHTKLLGYTFLIKRLLPCAFYKGSQFKVGSRFLYLSFHNIYSWIIMDLKDIFSGFSERHTRTPPEMACILFTSQ